MGTRSLIIAEFNEDVVGEGGYVASYCHWDGYLSNNGRILATAYNTDNDAFYIADSGYMSSLSETPELHEVAEQANSEPPVHLKDDEELQNYLSESWCEYAYLWNGDEWFVSSIHDGKSKWSAGDFYWHPLMDALSKEGIEVFQ